MKKRILGILLVAVMLLSGVQANGLQDDAERTTLKEAAVIENTYDSETGERIRGICYLGEGIIEIERGRRSGCINTAGELAVSCEYDDIGDFSEGFARVEKNDKYGYINTAGELVVPCEYDYVGNFSEGLARVEKNDKWDYINTAGELVFICEYDEIRSFSEGLAMVTRGDKYGYINTAGEMVIPCEYDYAGDFSEGLAGVRKDGKWGMINTAGELVIPCEYDCDEAIAYHGILFLTRVGELGYEFSAIDATGSQVLPWCNVSCVDMGDDTLVMLDDETITVYSIIEN